MCMLLAMVFRRALGQVGNAGFVVKNCCMRLRRTAKTGVCGALAIVLVQLGCMIAKVGNIGAKVGNIGDKVTKYGENFQVQNLGDKFVNTTLEIDAS